MAWGRAHARGMDEQIALEDSVSRGVGAVRQSRLCSYDPRLMQQCPYAVMEWRHGDQTCRYFSVALTDGGMEALCRRAATDGEPAPRGSAPEVEVIAEHGLSAGSKSHAYVTLGRGGRRTSRWILRA
jgi:hypothetical protein